MADRMYPSCQLFSKPIQNPKNGDSAYTTTKGAIRKEIEMCFEVLKSRFEILRRENRRWDKKEIIRNRDV